MSRSGRITRDFGDGRHEFFLGLAQLDELDEKTQVGPGTLLRRIAAGDFRHRDLREIIRLGLIGGGMKAIPALRLVERYCDPPNPLLESLDLAIAILQACLYAPEPKVKKKRGAPDEPEPTTTVSTSTSSMETVQ